MKSLIEQILDDEAKLEKRKKQREIKKLQKRIDKIIINAKNKRNN